MQELELKVRKTSFSGREWFDINVNLPNPRGAGKDIAIERTWDCLKVQDDGDGTELVTRTIGLDDSGHKIDVIYLVVSNAVAATVEVTLPKKLEDGLEHENGEDKGGSKYVYTAYVEITAHITGLKHPIVLFRRREEKEVVTIESSTLQLDRTAAVQVPDGKGLRIDMKLHINKISTSTEGEPMEEPDCLSFKFATPQVGSSDSEKGVIDEIEVEVKVTGPPKEKSDPEPAGEVKFIFGDFARSIENLLRGELAEANKANGVIDDEHGGKHPVLKLNRDKQQWIHIQLQVTEDGEETLLTTLAVRADKCYGVGFMNQSGVWYDLGNRRGKKTLPPEYNSVLLDWGVSYKDILDISDWDEAAEVLNSARLGKKFAEDAVHTLSRYPDVEEGENTRLALAGLIIMVCESARLNTVKKYFEDGWGLVDKKMKFAERGLMDYIWSWGRTSRALLGSKDHNYKSNRWDQEDSRLVQMGINGPKDALRDLCLVFKSANDAPEPKESKLPTDDSEPGIEQE